MKRLGGRFEILADILCEMGRQPWILTHQLSKGFVSDFQGETVISAECAEMVLCFHDHGHLAHRVSRPERITEFATVFRVKRDLAFEHDQRAARRHSGNHKGVVRRKALRFSNLHDHREKLAANTP